MKKINFSITKYEVGKPSYNLNIDGETQLENVPVGELRRIFYEMEKFARLRFRGEMQHTPIRKVDKERSEVIK